MSTFEQTLTQMAEGIRSDSDWLVSNHIRQGREHDERLAQAEQLLRHLLNLVVEQRARFAGYRRDEKVTTPPEQIRGGPRERQIAELRKTNAGEQRAAAT